MIEVTTRGLGKVKFEVAARGHRVICDQPPENGGEDSGMTPPEFLLASVGTCAMFYAGQYLKLHSIPTDGLEVKVTAEKLKQPARLGDFHIEIIVPNLESRHEAGLLRAVNGCLIKNTLGVPAAIETVVHSVVAI